MYEWGWTELRDHRTCLVTIELKYMRSFIILQLLRAIKIRLRTFAISLPSSNISLYTKTLYFHCKHFAKKPFFYCQYLTDMFSLCTFIANLSFGERMRK